MVGAWAEAAAAAAAPEAGIVAIGIAVQDMEAVAYMMGVFEVEFAAGLQD